MRSSGRSLVLVFAPPGRLPRPSRHRTPLRSTSVLSKIVAVVPIPEDSETVKWRLVAQRSRDLQQVMR